MKLIYAFIVGLSANIFGFSLGFFIQLLIPKPAADTLFPMKKFETNGSLYEFLGVKLFRDFLLRSGYNRMNKDVRMGKHNQLNLERLKNLIHLMQQGELLHFIGWVIATIISIYFLVKDELHLFWGISLLNIPLNLYPALLQRYNRIRIRKFYNSPSFQKHLTTKP